MDDVASTEVASRLTLFKSPSMLIDKNFELADFVGHSRRDSCKQDVDGVSLSRADLAYLAPNGRSSDFYDSRSSPAAKALDGPLD